MTQHISRIDQSGRILSIEMAFDAPRETVWDALTNPDHVVNWFGGEGFSNPVCTMDVRPAGLWRHVMEAPSGARFAFTSSYIKVEEPALISWKNIDLCKSPESPPSPRQVIMLDAIGEGTRLSLSVIYDSAADLETSERMGFSQMIVESFGRLARYLANDAAMPKFGKS